MTFDDFIAKWNGKGIDVDGFYGYQCFDLAHRYAIDCVGVDIPGQPAAKDLWNITIDGYDKIANTPDGVPQKGDIIIWGTGIGAYGHVAVFVSGDANSFTSLDQNWPIGSLCHLQAHNYTGVLGWFHPQNTVDLNTIPVLKSDFENMRKKCDLYDQFNAAGFQTVQHALDKIKASTDDSTRLQSKIDDLTSTLKIAENTATYQAKQVLGYQQEIEDLKKAIPTNGYEDKDVLLDKPFGIPVKVINVSR